MAARKAGTDLPTKSSNFDGEISCREILDRVEVIFPEIARYSRTVSMNRDGYTTQSHPKAIEITVSSPLNPTSYVDAKAFETNFDLEFEIIGKLENLIAIGNDFISYLYTYRSLSKALPEINIGSIDDLSMEEKNEVLNKKNEINKKVFDIMKPTIIKLKELVSYVSTCITQFYECVLHLLELQTKNLSIPSDFYESMIQLFDVLIRIDNLKDMKPSVQNDFSRYKRALGGQFTGEIMEELTRIQTFLTSPQDPRFSRNYIFLKLRNEIKNVSGHEDILFDMLMFTNEKYESSLHMLPDEKFQILRVLPYFLWMIDGNGTDAKSLNAFKQYKSRLGPIQKLCRMFPIVPIYGDVTIGNLFILQKCDHFDINTMLNQWSPSTENINDVGYDITNSWESIKKSYADYTNRLTVLLMKAIKSKDSFSKSNDEKNIIIAEEVVAIVKEGLLLLSSYNCRLKLFFAWKYTHPATPEQIAEGGDAISDELQNNPGFEYAKAIRYNVSKEDIYILVEMVGMIKSLATMLSDTEEGLAPIIRYHIHYTMQHLIQVDMIPLLHRVDKKNKRSLLNELLHIRHIGADWMFGVEPRDDYKSYMGNNNLLSRPGTVKSKFPSRIVGASQTQYRLLRSLVHSVYDDRSSARRKEGLFFSRTELRTDDITVFQTFYRDSFFYPYLLNLSGTLRDVSDIGDLWYREFYLELAKCVQFPIDMSIPWTLAENVISQQSSEDAPFIENIFYILDIYNDAAYRALYTLQQQHLYDEVEAETNLVFDQLVFLLADEVYNYYKNLAASSQLDRPYRLKLEELKASNNGGKLFSTGQPSSISTNGHHLSVPCKRYNIMAKQRSLNLLGRSIDFNFLICQHVNNKFIRDIDIAIRKFEANDLTAIVELVTIINILRYTHDMITKSCQFHLDDFTSMLGEVNESFSPTTFKGRISFQILRSLVLDIFPNFSYNFYTRRFTRSPIILRPVEYSKPPKQTMVMQLYGGQCYKAYEHWLKLSRGYFGRIHFEHLTAIMVYADLFMIIEESMKNVYEKLQELTGYIKALHGGIPPIMYSKYQFLSAGSYGYFEGKLKPILEYDDLKPEVYQGMREIGNTVVFLRDLSDILDIRSGFEFINLAPFVAVAPDTSTEKTSKWTSTPVGNILSSIRNYASSDKPGTKFPSDILYTSSIIDTIPQSTEIIISTLSHSLTERKSLFHGVLTKIEDYFYLLSLFDTWGPNMKESGRLPSIEDHFIPININSTKAFHKLWSALRFLHCLPQKQSQSDNIIVGEEVIISDEEEFGHGFTVAGCLFIHILKQRSTYELLDFSNYILKVFEYELSTKDPNQQNKIIIDESLKTDTEDFIDAAITHQKLESEVFSLLQAQFSGTINKTKSANLSKNLSKQKVVFHPTEDI